MKKLILLIAAVVLVMSLSACGDVCVGPECLGAVGSSSDEYEAGDGYAIPFTHINGEGHEDEMNAYVLMEWNKTSGYMIYQVTYLSCTCRPGNVNFWNTVYLEINKDTNDIRTISFENSVDANGVESHYIAGAWGDSSGAAEQNGVTYEMFKSDFFPWFIGKTSADLEGLNVWSNGTMYGEFSNTGANIDSDTVDSFAGSSVSTNNFLRMIIEVLAYHDEKYS